MRATVTKQLGTTRHSVGRIEEGQIVAEREINDRIWAIEIVPQDSGYYLFRLDINGECVADTWHATEEHAKRQAEFEFGTIESDWTD